MSTNVVLPSLFSELKNKILTREARVGIIGLGYVGLPLSLLYVGAKFPVTGFAIQSAADFAVTRANVQNGGRELNLFKR